MLELIESGEGTPDVALLYIGIADGLATVRRICRRHPDVGVIVLIVRADPKFIEEAVRAGVRGVALHDRDAEFLIWLVRSAAEGKLVIDPYFARPGTRSSSPLVPSRGAQEGRPGLVSPTPQSA